MTNQTHFTAEFFYKQFPSKSNDANRQMFYRLAATLKVDFIQMFRGPRVYSLRDWNKKVPSKYLLTYKEAK